MEGQKVAMEGTLLMKQEAWRVLTVSPRAITMARAQASTIFGVVAVVAALQP